MFEVDSKTFRMDRGQIVAQVGLQQSETSEFFQSEGSITVTKSAGTTAMEKRIFPRPASAKSMFRGNDKYTVDIHASLDEALAAENPVEKTAGLLASLALLSGSVRMDALVFRPMTDVYGAAYRTAEVYELSEAVAPWMSGVKEGKNKDGDKIVVHGKASREGMLGIYYPVSDIFVSNPLESLVKLRLLCEFGDRIFAPGSKYLDLIRDMIEDFYGRLTYQLNNKTVEELLVSPEIQLLVSLNGIVTGARRLSKVKEYMIEGPVGQFFGMSPATKFGGPAKDEQGKIDMYGPEMAVYIQENMDRINELLKYNNPAVENAMAESDDGIIAKFATSDIPKSLSSDLWKIGMPSIILSELATSIRAFQAARKALGKMRIRMGQRVRDYQRAMQNLDALDLVIESMPEFRNMKWTYDTARYRVKTQFGGWSFIPDTYRMYYSMVNPMAEIAHLVNPGGMDLSSQLIAGTSIMSYEPVAITKRNSPGNWLFDVPVDHMCVEIPVVYWTEDQEEWMDLKEWCGDQTQRVVRPSEYVGKGNGPLGQTDISGIYPLNVAVMEGPVQATAIRVDSMFRVDKERSLVKVDGNICLPPSSLKSRELSKMGMYQLPDRNVVAEQDIANVGDVPAGWDY